MCHKVICPECAKFTWSGCGNHVDQALAGVAPVDRCTCELDAAGTGVTTSVTSTSFRPIGR